MVRFPPVGCVVIHRVTVISFTYVYAGTYNEYVYCCNAGTWSMYSPGATPDAIVDPLSDTTKYTLGGTALFAAVAYTFKSHNPATAVVPDVKALARILKEITF